MRVENSYNCKIEHHSEYGVQFNLHSCIIQTFTNGLSNKGQNVSLLKVEVVKKSKVKILLEFEPRAIDEIPIVFRSFCI